MTNRHRHRQFSKSEVLSDQVKNQMESELVNEFNSAEFHQKIVKTLERNVLEAYQRALGFRVSFGSVDIDSSSPLGMRIKNHVHEWLSDNDSTIANLVKDNLEKCLTPEVVKKKVDDEINYSSVSSVIRDKTRQYTADYLNTYFSCHFRQVDLGARTFFADGPILSNILVQGMAEFKADNGKLITIVPYDPDLDIWWILKLSVGQLTCEAAYNQKASKILPLEVNDGNTNCGLDGCLLTLETQWRREYAIFGYLTLKDQALINTAIDEYIGTAVFKVAKPLETSSSSQVREI